MKKFKTWLRSKSLWLQGGIWGIFTCLFLTIFYYFFFRILFFFGDPPNLIALPAMLTGHLFLPLILYHFDASPIYIKFFATFGYMILLSGAYFFLGTLMGLLVEKVKSRK